MANRKKYLTEFKARLCSVVAGTMAEIAELAYSLPREKDYKGASYISYSDRALKKIACGHRLRIYREISSNTFKKHFPQMKKIDALKASEFTKTLMLMTSLGFDNNEIIVFLLTDKRTISSTRSRLKKIYNDNYDFFQTLAIPASNRYRYNGKEQFSWLSHNYFITENDKDSKE